MSTFADQAALALQRAENQSARRELEVLADRDRIARDLHDHVIQRLFAIGLAMQGTHRRAKSPAAGGRGSTDHIDQLTRSSRRSAPRSSTCRPARPRHRGCAATLHEVINELTADAAVRTTVRMSGPLDVIPPDLAQHVQAVVREAVSNVVRHAGRQRTRVTVSVDDQIVVDVSDNGRGIPETMARSGLHNLKRRASESAGSLTVSPGEHGGTRLVWSAPLP